MTLSATYIGPDGYVCGQQYTLLVLREGRTLRIAVAAPHGRPKNYAAGLFLTGIDKQLIG